VRVVEWEGAEMAGCRVGGGGGDCLIKLFGKTIPVPEVAAAAAAVGEADKVGFSVHPDVLCFVRAGNMELEGEVVCAWTQ